MYGVLTDGEGRPVAVDVYPGNTGDPRTVPDQVGHLQTTFGIARIVLVGDRGTLTEAQLRTLRAHPGLGWISALRSPAIRELIAGGTLQRSLFDEQHLAEITAPDFPMNASSPVSIRCSRMNGAASARTCSRRPTAR